jgi:hypothetical protein
MPLCSIIRLGVDAEAILTPANALKCSDRLPEGRESRYVRKLDGFRAIGRKAGRVMQSGRRAAGR